MILLNSIRDISTMFVSLDVYRLL